MIIVNNYEKNLQEKQKGHVFIDEPTIAKLFKINSNAACLYMFYCMNVSLQTLQFDLSQNNSAHCPDSYCKKKLHWGASKFYRAKNILLNKNLITQN